MPEIDEIEMRKKKWEKQRQRSHDRTSKIINKIENRESEERRKNATQPIMDISMLVLNALDSHV